MQSSGASASRNRLMHRFNREDDDLWSIKKNKNRVATNSSLSYWIL